ncbi:packaged DNA stabilization gp4 family protein [Planococcus sp. MERTA32b]|nr:packaged DNA stabilization gp4 family protein [Planococcus sp. MER TA 32b]
MHPYQEYIEKLENELNKNIKDIIHEYYIIQDEGPSVTARELGIPRKAVLHFIYEYNLRPLKHQNIKKKVTISLGNLQAALQSSQELPQSHER